MLRREWPGGGAAADLDPAPGGVPVPLEPVMVVLRGWIGWRVFKFILALLAAACGAARRAPEPGWTQADGGSCASPPASWAAASWRGCSPCCGCATGTST